MPTIMCATDAFDPGHGAETEAFALAAGAVSRPHGASAEQPTTVGRLAVSEVMEQPVVTIEETATCADALESMAAQRIRHLPVLDQAGRLVGIVTATDLRRYLFSPEVVGDIGTVPAGVVFGGRRVADVMSTSVATATPAECLEAVARRMAMLRIGALPVVEAGHVVGIVSETDVLERLACAEDARAERT